MPFQLLDPLVGLLSGALIAFTLSQIVAPDWSMLAGMVAGGLAGLALKLFLTLLLAPFLGAFEVMIPLSLIGMFVGMSSGLAAALGLSPLAITLGGAGAGLAVALLVQASNRRSTRSPSHGL